MLELEDDPSPGNRWLQAHHPRQQIGWLHDGSTRFEDGNSYDGTPQVDVVTCHAWIAQLADSRVPLEAWLHSFSMLSFSSTADAQKQTIRVILRFSWHHHFMSFKTHVFPSHSPHRSLSSLEQNPGKDDQRQRGPHPTGVCWCQMNFQEHRVMHVDGHPILEIFWKMIQTWQQVTNITCFGKSHRNQ